MQAFEKHPLIPGIVTDRVWNTLPLTEIPLGKDQLVLVHGGSGGIGSFGMLFSSYDVRSNADRSFFLKPFSTVSFTELMLQQLVAPIKWLSLSLLEQMWSSITRKKILMHV